MHIFKIPIKKDYFKNRKCKQPDPLFEITRDPNRQVPVYNKPLRDKKKKKKKDKHKKKEKHGRNSLSDDSETFKGRNIDDYM